MKRTDRRADKRLTLHIAGAKDPGVPQRCIRCRTIMAPGRDTIGWGTGALVAYHGRGTWKKVDPQEDESPGQYRPCEMGGRPRCYEIEKTVMWQQT
jgi:hypothetical protein